MSMFHPELISFLALLNRSKPEEGWYAYSKATKGLVEVNDRKFPGLFKVEPGRVRLTDEGEIIMKWFNFKPQTYDEFIKSFKANKEKDSG